MGSDFTDQFPAVFGLSLLLDLHLMAHALEQSVICSAAII